MKEVAKNFNLLVGLSDDRKLLVKQERHRSDGTTANEFFNEWQFHQLLHQCSEMCSIASSVSQMLHFDDRNSILVYNYLTDYWDLARFYHQAKVFPTAIARSLGQILATLHRTTFDRQICRDSIARTSEETPRYQFGNPARGLGRIGPEIFGTVPADGIKFFVLYQRYESLGAAVAKLEQAWHPCCLTHNDLKFNNILIRRGWEENAPGAEILTEGTLRLIDWERCDWGDPAFDLGTLLASYLGMWLSNLVVEPSIALEESLRLAVTPLEALQPSMLALTQAYLSNWSAILEYRKDFLQRAIQFAGLALIHQIRARIYYQKTFDNTGICLLQVAKSLLCRPERSAPTLFGQPTADLEYRI